MTVRETMHGLIFAELKKFVVAKAGGETWNKLLVEAGVGEKTIFMPNQVYADDQLQKLVAAGSRLTGMPAMQLQEAFGEFIAPDLLKLYETQINPAWKTLDLVEKTESMVHRAVRIKVPGADPPRLVCTRPAPDNVVMQYSSNRRMCGVATGIIKGVATTMHENVQVTQKECMERGAPQCIIDIRLVK